MFYLVKFLVSIWCLLRHHHHIFMKIHVCMCNYLFTQYGEGVLYPWGPSLELCSTIQILNLYILSPFTVSSLLIPFIHISDTIEVLLSNFSNKFLAMTSSCSFVASHKELFTADIVRLIQKLADCNQAFHYLSLIQGGQIFSL